MNLPSPLVTLLVVVGAVSAAPSQSTADLIREGNVYDQRFQADKALSLYQQAERGDPGSADLQIRIARQYRHLMTDAGSKSEKIELGKKAVHHSQRAAQLAPNDPNAQVDLAITYGKMSPLLSGGERVAASREIRRSVDRTLAIDSRNDTAWHILGRWQTGMAEITGLKRSLAEVAYGDLPDSSLAEAARSLERARLLNESRLMHPIELGIVYLKLDRTDEGRKLIEKGLSMPNREKDDPAKKSAGREALSALR
ncbi:MAG: hypothetical protein WA771_11630 [Chthoniobacterales bacterium]